MRYFASLRACPELVSGMTFENFTTISLCFIFILGGFLSFEANAHAETIDSLDLAIWHFDENSGAVAYDAASGQNTLNWGYNPWGGGRVIPERVEGKWDLGIYFNQREELFSFSNSTPIEFPNGLTAGIWIKTDLSSNYKSRFFWLGNTIDRFGIPSNYFMLSIKDGRVYLNLSQGSVWQRELISNNRINNNQWHFINAKFDAEKGIMALFVDGQKQAESDFDSPIPAFERVNIGRREYYHDPYDTNFRGAADDIWIRADVLTDGEISQIYQSNQPYKAEIILPVDVPAAIKAYYNFDDLSDNAAYDMSDNSYALNWGYNPWGGGETVPRQIDGKYSGGANFKKVEDLFSRNFSPVMDFPNGAVIGVWIKTADNSSPPARILWAGNSFNYSGDPANHFAILEHQGKIEFEMHFSDYDRRFNLVSDKLINDNNWHFLTVVLDPRPFYHSMKLYVDGALEAEGFFPDLLPLAERIRVGFRENYFCGSQCNFNGDIDDLFILSSVISDDKIQQIYQSNQPFIQPLKPDPVIIVPGIMGSWNVSGKWEIDPILHTYDNLWEAFKSAGYEEDKTLFAFPYQWRNSNVISASYLKNKINEVKSICECEKVDIVAHSMGGFVARYYVESDDYENDIDQLVFLGVPHKGAPKSYLTWEAAEGFEKFEGWIAKKYLSIEAHLLGYDSLFKYIQNKVKSVEQLLPVYPYLRDIGSVKLREYNQNLYPDNYPYNSFLESLNSEENLNRFSSSGVKVFNIAGGNGDNTIGVINVSSGEQYYPKWEHGYREEVIYISGDDEVPHMSSSLFPTTEINNTVHRQIPTNAQKQIIEYLTGRMPVIEINDTPKPEEILVVAIHSPADFVIISPSGKRLGKDFLSNTNINQIDYAFYTGFEDEPEFAVIINPEQGDYRVELQGTGNREYKLDLSYINEEQEITKEFTGNIQQSQIQSFDFIYEAKAENPISELEPDDNIPPEITINNPRENEQYLHSENLVIDYIASDDFSGVANIVINMDNQILSTTSIDLFYYDLGEYVLNITAVDNAGNSANVEVKFKIITNIDSTIRDIERIYNLSWINKKYVKQILIAQLEVLQKRLDIFAKQKDNIEKLKQKLSDNPKIKEKHKQKALDQFDKLLQELEQQEDKFIKKSLSLLVKMLDKFLQKAVISRQGYDIIISDIEYLKINL